MVAIADDLIDSSAYEVTPFTKVCSTFAVIVSVLKK